jgi:serine/threonine-protein kinase
MVKFIEKTSGSKATADTLTRAGAVFGTPAYMSPEQAKGNPADARTDVYAAGCLLFELVSGKRPFLENTPEAVVMAHLTSPVPSLTKIRPGLGTAATLLQPVIEKAMAKKPGSRFKDASAMLTALEAVIDKLPAEGTGGRSEARRKTTGRARTVSRTGGSRFLRWVVTLVLLGAGVATAATYLRTRLRAYLRHDEAPRMETAAPPPKPPRKHAAVAEAPPKPTPIPERPTPPPPPPAKTQAPEEQPPAAEKEPPPPPPSEHASRPRARNPWRAPVPRQLKSIRAQLDHGGHPSQKALSPLYEFAHANPDDPRPWLLLGTGT